MIAEMDERRSGHLFWLLLGLRELGIYMLFSLPTIFIWEAFWWVVGLISG